MSHDDADDGLCSGPFEASTPDMGAPPSPSRSVSLEFEGTERLREDDAGLPLTHFIPSAFTPPPRVPAVVGVTVQLCSEVLLHSCSLFTRILCYAIPVPCVLPEMFGWLCVPGFL